MIYEKLLKIMEDCSYLLKDMQVGSGNFAYKAVSDEQVKIKVRESMIKNKVFGHVTSIKEDYDYVTWNEKNKYGEKQKHQYTCKINGSYKFVDVENPDSTLEIPFFGYSIDSGDKADGKAMTYAIKYMFVNCFVMPSGDDSDKVNSNDIEAPKPPAKQNPPLEKPNWAGHLSNLIVKLKKQGDITEGRINQIKKDWTTINHETLYRELLQSDSQKK